MAVSELAAGRSGHGIVGARWTPKVNLIEVACPETLDTQMMRTDRWWHTCKSCGERLHIDNLRRGFVRR